MSSQADHPQRMPFREAQKAWDDFGRTGHGEDLDRVVTVLRNTLVHLPPGTPEWNAAFTNLGAALLRRYELAGRADDVEEAAQVLRAAIDGLPEGDRRRVPALTNLGAVHLRRYELAGRAEDVDQAIQVLGVAVEQLSETDHDVAALTNLGVALLLRHNQSDHEADVDRAMAVLRTAVGRLRPDEPEYLTALSILGDALRAKYERTPRRLIDEDDGQLRSLSMEAVRIYREVLNRRRLLLGDDHPQTLASMNNLAVVLQNQGDLEAAERLHRETYARAGQVLGPEHPTTLSSMNNLAGALRDLGDLNGAKRLYEQTLALRTRLYGTEHPSTLASMHNLAGVLRSTGDLTLALRMYEQVLTESRRVLGHEHPSTLVSMTSLAGVRRELGDVDGARELYRQALEVSELVLGPDHPRCRSIVGDLAALWPPGDRVRHVASTAETEVALTMLGGDSGEARSLAKWIEEEPTLRGTLRLTEPALDPGAMGSLSDTIAVALASASVSPFVRALVSWIRARPRRARLVITAPDGNRIELSTSALNKMAPVAEQDLVDSLTTTLRGS
ncbi:tetratricopeptide repeat protein [Micromonospora sp. MA102]|uniref:tetratricopeptide repeat protein n=1 Tax=Micromonospora sp. MA102 TaxID=2952755 RepID=UPI0021C75232|nr:tetratricopeptide repeat protein [Micromonospora sp. MA102]